MSEFKGTKGKWIVENYNYGELLGVRVTHNDCYSNEENIFDSDTRGYLWGDLIELINEKRQLIKKATEL